MDIRKSGAGDVSSRVVPRGHDGHHPARVAGPRSRQGRRGQPAWIAILAFTASLAAPPAWGAAESAGSDRKVAAERESSDDGPTGTTPTGTTPTETTPTETELDVRTVTYGNGDHYEGEWLDNAPHGSGSYSWANGDRYEGQWKAGRMDGEGTYVWTDGALYTGSWRDGLRHGAGSFSWADGDRMHGEWHEGTRLVARADCLTVERTPDGTTPWVNRCEVGVDVLWRDEGACGSTDTQSWPCSWYVGPHDSAAASIEGQVWWRECKSPGGLGDVVAAEKEDGTVYCVDDAGLVTLAETRRKRQQARNIEAAARDAALNAARDAARDAAQDAAQDAARDTAQDAARNAAQDAARDAAQDAARDATQDAARDTARDAARRSGSRPRR